MQDQANNLLKKRLVDFWSGNQHYFQEARNANIKLTEERRKLLSYIKLKDKVLDVGCGTSEIGRYISRYAHYFGVDVSSAALEMANDYKADRFNVLQGNAERLPFKDGCFDVVISTASLEHFVSLIQILNEMRRVLKPSGKLILLCSGYDCFYAIPPSLEWLGPLSRQIFILKQMLKYTAALFFKKYYFEIVKKPAVLSSDYKPDRDLVCIITTQELLNYLRSRHFKILYVRQRSWEDGKGKKRLKGLIKKLKFIRWCIRYWNLGLMIVAQDEKIYPN